jgi:hypothetical protein
MLTLGLSERRKARCEECEQVKEMATTSECFACYRRRKRAEEAERNYPDLHNPGVRREHTRLLKGYSRLIGALADLKVGKEDLDEIRGVLAPYLTLLVEAGLISPVNSEPVAVHVHWQDDELSEDEPSPRNPESTDEPLAE